VGRVVAITALTATSPKTKKKKKKHASFSSSKTSQTPVSQRESSSKNNIRERKRQRSKCLVVRKWKDLRKKK
jgi:hypothetical protein